MKRKWICPCGFEIIVATPDGKKPNIECSYCERNEWMKAEVVSRKK